MIGVISSKANQKIGHNLCRMQYLMVASMQSKYIIWLEVFLQFLEVREGICGGRLVNATCCVNLSLMVKVSVAFLCAYDSIYAWDVENTWLTSLICISDCRQMKCIWISNRGRHSRFRTKETHHGWHQRWLQWHWAQCKWTNFHGIRSLQNMWRMDNLRRWCNFSNKCNKKEWILTNSLLFRKLTHLLV